MTFTQATVVALAIVGYVGSTGYGLGTRGYGGDPSPGRLNYGGVHSDGGSSYGGVHSDGGSSYGGSLSAAGSSYGGSSTAVGLSHGRSQSQNALPHPYSFESNAADEYGNVHYRSEQGDHSGNVRGTYGYYDAQGLYRIVEYVADKYGFRANIRTNEPGVDGKDPGDVVLSAEESPERLASGVSSGDQGSFGGQGVPGGQRGSRRQRSYAEQEQDLNDRRARQHAIHSGEDSKYVPPSDSEYGSASVMRRF